MYSQVQKYANIAKILQLVSKPLYVLISLPCANFKYLWSWLCL